MNIERTGNAGIKCDNIECGYTDTESPDENLADWLNVPCPMCGENLLTQEDLDTSIRFDKMVDMINNMSEEELIEFNKSMAAMYDIPTMPEDFAAGDEFIVDIHNGVKLEFVTKK